MLPEHTVNWTMLGYPPPFAVIPLWVKMGKDQPSSIQYDVALHTVPNCYYTSRLKDKVYSIHRSNGQKYLHWQLLWNEENTGYIQQLQDAETQIFRLFKTISFTNDKQFPDTEKNKSIL